MFSNDFIAVCTIALNDRNPQFPFFIHDCHTIRRRRRRRRSPAANVMLTKGQQVKVTDYATHAVALSVRAICAAPTRFAAPELGPDNMSSKEGDVFAYGASAVLRFNITCFLIIFVLYYFS